MRQIVTHFLTLRWWAHPGRLCKCACPRISPSVWCFRLLTWRNIARESPTFGAQTCKTPPSVARNTSTIAECRFLSSVACAPRAQNGIIRALVLLTSHALHSVFRRILGAIHKHAQPQPWRNSAGPPLRRAELRLSAQARPPRNYLPGALAQRGLAFYSATVTASGVSSSATALEGVGLGHGTCRDI